MFHLDTYNLYITINYTTKYLFLKYLSASENEIFVDLLTSGRYSSSKLLLAPSGDGFIAFKGPPDSMFREFFQFKCTMAGCEWIESNQKFKEEHYHPVIMYIPNSLTNCRKKAQEELEEEAMIRNQIKELHEQFLALSREYKELDTNPNLNRDRIKAIRDARNEIRVKLEQLSKFGINVEIPYYLQ